MNTEVKVSIILPTWKEAKHIRRAIESVIYQTFYNWELIIIADGLYEGIENVIKEYINKDKRIIFLKNEKNLGIQKTSNRGLKEAKGEYIARIDDDDEWINKNKLQKQLEFLENNKDYVLVGTGVVVVNEEGEEQFRYFQPKSDKEIRNKILFKNCFINSSVLFRKDIALELGGYSEEENVKHIEDYEMCLKLGTVGKVHNLPTYSTKYTFRKGSISSDNKMDQFSKNLNLIKRYKRMYSHYMLSLILRYFILLGYRIFNAIPFNSLKNKLIKLYKRI